MGRNTTMENVVGILFMLLILLAMGFCGGIEQGTIPLW